MVYKKVPQSGLIWEESSCSEQNPLQALITTTQPVTCFHCIASHSGHIPSYHFSSFMEQAFAFSLFKLSFFLTLLIRFISIKIYVLRSFKFSVGPRVSFLSLGFLSHRPSTFLLNSFFSFCCRSIGR